MRPQAEVSAKEEFVSNAHQHAKEAARTAADIPAAPVDEYSSGDDYHDDEGRKGKKDREMEGASASWRSATLPATLTTATIVTTGKEGEEHEMERNKKA